MFVEHAGYYGVPFRAFGLGGPRVTINCITSPTLRAFDPRFVFFIRLNTGLAFGGADTLFHAPSVLDK